MAGWLGGCVVGKSDFNENPVVSLDLDLDLDLDLGFVKNLLFLTEDTLNPSCFLNLFMAKLQT